LYKAIIDAVNIYYKTKLKLPLTLMEAPLSKHTTSQETHFLLTVSSILYEHKLRIGKWNPRKM
jgi:hypothetical protein